jgi:hypothetical protein
MAWKDLRLLQLETLETLVTGRSLRRAIIKLLVNQSHWSLNVKVLRGYSHLPLVCSQGRCRHVNIFIAESHFSGFFFSPLVFSATTLD